MKVKEESKKVGLKLSIQKTIFQIDFANLKSLNGHFLHASLMAL